MQSKDLDDYKRMLKAHLLKGCKEERNIEKNIEKLNQIDRLDRMKDEDKDEFYLRRMVKKNNQIS